MFLFPVFAFSVEISPNRYGLKVVEDLSIYEALVAEDPAKALVDLESFIPGLAVDVRYATRENFMGEKLYPVAKVYLRRPAAEALRAVQKELAEEGLGLKVFDGYRPYRVTEKMWERYGDPDFVADPKSGSRHNRGCAVDVTLISLKTGEALPMPTGYDEFTKAAAADFADLPEEVIKNREVLRKAMDRHGFEMLPSEWWHFDFRGWEKFELMNVPLDKLP